MKKIWISQKYRKLGEKTHEITNNVFKIWDNLLREIKWDYNSLLGGTTFFAPGIKKNFGEWIEKAQLRKI